MQRNSPNIIKYPRLIIIGEMIKIIELNKNKICCKNKIFLKLIKRIDKIKPNNVTIIPIIKLKINEFFSAFKKYCSKNNFCKGNPTLNFDIIYIIGENKNNENNIIIK